MKRSRFLVSRSTLILLLLATMVLLLAACTTPAGPVVAPMYDPNGSVAQEQAAAEDSSSPTLQQPPASRGASSVAAATIARAGADAAKIEKPQPTTPVVAAPVPLMGTTVTPLRDECVVYQNGRVRYEDLPIVRSGPHTEASVIGRLGNNHWARGVQVQNGWYEIIVAPGQTGWVNEEGVGDNGRCDPGPARDVPVIMNRGAPANYRCVAMRAGFNPESPPVYNAPDTQSTLVAHLGNWAEVQEVATGWYRVLIPQGGSGWVEAGRVELTVGCGTSGPIHSQTSPV